MKNAIPFKIEVHLSTQILELWEHDRLIKKYRISTAKNGAGEEWGSFKTPRGRHLIRAKIGLDAPVNAVFVERRWTGEIYTPELRVQFPERDWILTRIMWLSGLEVGKNRLGKCDTMRRYVYIHGTPDETQLGTPGSRGCIRMNNKDIIEVFDLITPGTEVQIRE